MTHAHKATSHLKPIGQRREEALRPCQLLGYDHDELAQYLMKRRALKIAEDEFRRAIWLNPYEPLFKEHLALCLAEQKRFDEAQSQITEVLDEKPTSQSAKDILQMIQQSINEIARKAVSKNDEIPPRS